MPEPVVPAPLTYVEPAGEPSVRPAGEPVTEPGAAWAPAGSVPASTLAAASSVPASLRAAALRVLARDGRDLTLQPWQVAYLVATTEGREGVVPLGCGVGKGWLQARLDEAASADAGD